VNARRRIGQRWARLGGKRRSVVVVALVALYAGAGVWLFASGAWRMVPAFLRGQGVFGWFFAIVLVAVQSLVPYAPFVLIAGIISYVHGFWAGLVATWTGALLGACAVFGLTRGAARAVTGGRLPGSVRRHPRVAAALSRLRSQSSLAAGVWIAALRLQPWLPSSIIDVAAAVAGVRWPVFVVASAVGLAPIVAAHVYVGGRLLTATAQARELWWLAAGGAVIVAGYGAWRRWRRRRVR